ncbi:MULTISPECIES: DUF6230 family protein [Streptomyces]|uniref:Cholesterol esterase n=3 Tax=Actinomycetes TaxID=1760 RepID=A0A2N8PCZ0_STRNR|nr:MULTISPECIES: DUF6230 family protein [Streptomyces]ANZ16211.1 hypothetical protein SNOUR_14545 [Streptomyces noursei ATCC 11455]MCZ0993335.1 DUF6230 family protein [Streptomyces noursei]PNE38889.1 cholesterol esterase [Streptomyces noursei]QRX94339.1 cholesterol esterase [Streptomyces noursei]UJB44049.1 cholesterol esterase [Streptomyces sp. A1-5]
MESLTRGGTRWKRFAVVMVPSVAATAAIGVALSQGALAASFSVSGQQFKVSTDRLDGTGFVQYGAVDAQKNGTNVPVAVSAFSTAKIRNLCQSVVVPVPLFGDVSMKLQAGGGKDPVEAKNLYIDLDQLNADATFNNINIGVAAGSTSKGPGIKKGDKADPGSFAQEADTATLTKVQQRAWATTAGTFKLSGLKMSVSKGKNECY